MSDKKQTRNKYFVEPDVVGKIIPLKGGKKIVLRETMTDREIQQAVHKGVHISHFRETEIVKTGERLEVLARQAKRTVRKVVRKKAVVVFPKSASTADVKIVEKIVEVKSDADKILALAEKLSDIKKAKVIFAKEVGQYSKQDSDALKKAYGFERATNEKLFKEIHG